MISPGEITYRTKRGGTFAVLFVYPDEIAAVRRFFEKERSVVLWVGWQIDVRRACTIGIPDRAVGMIVGIFDPEEYEAMQKHIAKGA